MVVLIKFPEFLRVAMSPLHQSLLTFGHYYLWWGIEFGPGYQWFWLLGMRRPNIWAWRDSQPIHFSTTETHGLVRMSPLLRSHWSPLCRRSSSLHSKKPGEFLAKLLYSYVPWFCSPASVFSVLWDSLYGTLAYCFCILVTSFTLLCRLLATRIALTLYWWSLLWTCWSCQNL